MIVDPLIIDAIEADVKRLIVLCYINWPTGAIRVHNRVGEKRWDNETWLGIGEMGQVSGIQGGSQIGSFNLTFNSPDISLLSEVNQDDAIGSEVKLYYGALDANRRISAAQLIAYRFVSDISTVPGKVHQAVIACGGARERFKNAKDYHRFSAAAWREKYPNDSYCDDVEALAKGPLSSYSGNNAVGTRSTGGTTGGQRQP